MNFIADFHIHSKYSRATSKALDLENIYVGALKKGLSIVATGDFTHPGWFSEIKKKLVFSQNGLFELKTAHLKQAEQRVPPSCRNILYFILSCEISNIYKKNGQVRKNHNLVVLPDLESAEKLNRRLEKIGNIRSDGRPILGLDARDLLEIVLEISESAFLIPAHIWTPWFSLFGSKSGFDTLGDCFEDLAPHIFALETGLSSDPEMNWRVSQLDGFALVSNSDAHSIGKLAREANLFDAELSFSGIRRALKEKKEGRFKGTLEFFPEEGKYHLDGHRKCGIRLEPEETVKCGGRCPECGKLLTKGVLHRVLELADRNPGMKPEGAPGFHRMLPLEEILAEVFNVGTGSKRIQIEEDRIIKKLGPELSVLLQVPLEELESLQIPLLAEAIRRARSQEIRIQPGFDGQFGTIKIFRPNERKAFFGQKSLFVSIQIECSEKPGVKNPADKTHFSIRTALEMGGDPKDIKEKPVQANSKQLLAIQSPVGPVLVMAGPGTGKTHTLTQRIAGRIRHDGIAPDSLLAVTFTQKAAVEMKERLARLLQTNVFPKVCTFHSLCLDILKETARMKGEPFIETIIDEIDRRRIVSEAVRRLKRPDISGRTTVDRIMDWIASKKQGAPVFDILEKKEACVRNSQFFKDVHAVYESLLKAQGLLDYESLILRANTRLETDTQTAIFFRKKFVHLYVDEYQDINAAQYRLIRLLYPGADPGRDLFVIGDPNQAIYRFRGSDVRFFNRFTFDFPGAAEIRLDQNYRSSRIIQEASFQVIRKSASPRAPIDPEDHNTPKPVLLEYQTESNEVRGIANRIEALVGGTDFLHMNSGRPAIAGGERSYGFSEIAVLFRVGRLGERIAEGLQKNGIPCQAANKKTLLTETTAGICSILKLISNRGAFLDFERALSFWGIPIGKKSVSDFKDFWLSQWDSGSGFLRRIFEARNGIAFLKAGSAIETGVKRLLTFQENAPSQTVAQWILALAETRVDPREAPEDKVHLEARERLITIAEAYGKDISGFLDAVALKKDPDLLDSKAQKVSLLTLHASKGLEFPVVFIAGCEDGWIPHARSKEHPEELEEERRLFYVAVSRAEERLFFTHVKNRFIFGRTSARKISPFLLNIEKNLLQYETDAKKTPELKKHTQRSLF